MKFKTQLLHSHQSNDQHGSLTIPIYQSSTYSYPDFESGKQRFSGNQSGYIYSRMGNPTLTALEEQLANIEGAEQSLVVSSGMAAISSIFFALAAAGDHIAVVEPVYGGSSALLTQTLSRFGVTVTRYFSDQDLLERIHSETKLIIFEPLCNPTLSVVDYRVVKQAADKTNAIVICDNTFLTPYLFRPLEHGIDLVMHSGTKYLSGHGDIIAGVVSGRSELIDKIRTIGLKHLGAQIGPQEAYLLHRGLRTLPLRMDAHLTSALQIANFLNSHPKINKVYYPGLLTHAGHKALAETINAFGSVMSFEVIGDEQECARLLDNLTLFTQAVSLGDLESLACHPATTTHAALTEQQRQQANITSNLIRLSIGVEDGKDLIADLSQALEAVPN
ncbi:MAG: trans-sulfuration enzyme family protein [Parashewanella sp.]